MAPFVLLALALAVVALGAAAVAALQLRRGVRRLRAGVDQVTQQVRPLIDELSAEAAVAGTEVEALQRRIAALQQDRSAAAVSGRRRIRV